MSPVVSFLMPVAAPAPFLVEALESVLRQSFDSWELVLVVDGSDPEVVRQATDLVPAERLSLVELPVRQGISRALNAGLAAARGELIARIDSDDRCHEHRLEMQVAAMKAWPEVSLVGSAATLIDENGVPRGARVARIGRDVRVDLIRRNQFVHSSVMFRRNLAESIGSYNPECLLREDYDLWLRMACLWPVANLSEPLVDYRISSGQISSGSPPREALDLVREAQGRLAKTMGLGKRRTSWAQMLWRRAQTGPGRSILRWLRSGGRSSARPRQVLRGDWPAVATSAALVPATLGEIQAALLSGLKELDRIAVLIGVDYFLAAGSALGAHRHDGFIPWDDDIDVAMTFSDFRRFLVMAPRLVACDYVFHTRADEPILGANGKLYLEGTRIEGEFGVKHGLTLARHDGLFIDIFVVFSLSNSRVVRAWERLCGWLVYVSPWSWRMFRSPSSLGVSKRIRYAAVALVPKFLLRRVECRLWRRSERRDGSLVGLGIGGVNGRVYPRNVVLPPRPVEFQGFSTWGPRDPEWFLSITFGPDYMQLPPVDERPQHSAKVFINRHLDRG